MSIVQSVHNAMSASQHPDQLLPDLRSLEELGYAVFAVASLDVLYTNPYVPSANHSLDEVAGSGQYDVVMSGPDNFPVPGQSIREPVGPVMRNERQDVVGNPSASNRGAVAVLRDGTVIMGRTDGTTKHELERRFGQYGNPLASVLGGGAVLIEDAKMVPERDLILNQMYIGQSNGFMAASMQEGNHTMMGIRRGRAYAAWCTRKSGRDIQGDFHRFGFGCLIKFAYGAGVFFDDQVRRVNGLSPAGFGIHRAH